MSKNRTVHGLEINENIPFQEWFWRVEYAG